jgi:hypothetical protein
VSEITEMKLDDMPFRGEGHGDDLINRWSHNIYDEPSSIIGVTTENGFNFLSPLRMANEVSNNFGIFSCLACFRVHCAHLQC